MCVCLAFQNPCTKSLLRRNRIQKPRAKEPAQAECVVHVAVLRRKWQNAKRKEQFCKWPFVDVDRIRLFPLHASCSLHLTVMYYVITYFCFLLFVRACVCACVWVCDVASYHILEVVGFDSLTETGVKWNRNFSEVVCVYHTHSYARICFIQTTVCSLCLQARWTIYQS